MILQRWVFVYGGSGVWFLRCDRTGLLFICKGPWTRAPVDFCRANIFTSRTKELTHSVTVLAWHNGIDTFTFGVLYRCSYFFVIVAWVA